MRLCVRDSLTTSVWSKAASRCGLRMRTRWYWTGQGSSSCLKVSMCGKEANTSVIRIHKPHTLRYNWAPCLQRKKHRKTSHSHALNTRNCKRRFNLSHRNWTGSSASYSGANPRSAWTWIPPSKVINCMGLRIQCDNNALMTGRAVRIIPEHHPTVECCGSCVQQHFENG